MDESFGDIITLPDIALDQEYLPPEMYEAEPLCAGFGDYGDNDDLVPASHEPAFRCSMNEFSMETFGSATYGEFINPDDFLNDVVTSDPEYGDTSPSTRDTPSPSGSQQSFDSLPSSGGFEGCHVVPMQLESPPVSPQSPIGCTPSPPTKYTESTAKSGTASLRRVTVAAVPKSSTASATKTITKKTIVLSAKDYKALIANMQRQPSNNTILVKATPTKKIPIMAQMAAKNVHVLGASAKQQQQQQQQEKLPVLPKPQPTSACSLGSDRNDAAHMTPREQPTPEASPVTVPMILASGINISEQTIDERLLKKHQRMIKNRESAYMSRVKKKEYVTSLEERIQNLTDENERLKTENANLLERLKVRCSCAASNLLIGNSAVKQVSPAARKNAAIVLAMLFMVSLNIYPIGHLLINNERPGFDDAPLPETPEFHARGLLWFNESSVPVSGRTSSPHLNLTALDELTKQDTAGFFPECPFYVNQTENIRLASELRRWIGNNGYKNLTDGNGEADMTIDTFDRMFRLKDTIDSMYRQMKDISVQMKTFERRQKSAALTGKQKKRKLGRVQPGQSEITPYRGRVPHRPHELDLYYPTLHGKYAEFFEEIGRRDDTFYLVSFSEEHLLLPALAYNKTNRPRMSLMLPTVASPPGGSMENGTGRTDKITLMQIDCEVMNTSVIQIREKMIPGDLRPHGAGEAPKGTNTTAGRGYGAGRNTPGSNSTGHNVHRRHANGTEGASRLVRELRSNISTPTQSGGIVRKETAGPHQHAPSRPFFVERMNEHLKSEHHVN